MTTTAGSASPAQPTAALLRDRTFGPYFAANLVSNAGTWFQNIAAAIVVFNLTRSAVLVGAVSILQFAPSLVLSPYAGAVTDRVDRRLLLIGGQLLAFTASAVLAVWTLLAGVDGLPGPAPVLVVALLIGVGYAFSVPAMQALVPALVPPADLDSAIALNSVTFNLARAAGPVLATLTLVAFGPPAAFAVNAASYLPLLVVLAVVRPRPVKRTRGDRSVRAGLRFVRADGVSTVVLLGVAGLGFGTDPVNTLTPPLAASLGGGDALVGWLVSAFGAGAAASALLGGPMRRRLSHERLALLGLALLATGLVALAASPLVVLALVALAAMGVGFLLAVTALTTLLQQRVDEDLRGRIMALWGVAFLGSRPLAAAVDGALADVLGPRVALAVAAAVTAGTALVVWSGFRRHARASAAASGDPSAA